MNIFVSYTTRDSFINSTSLLQLESELKFLGTAYIDILHNRSIAPQLHVIKMLDLADIFIAFISPHYLCSEWVLFELEYAIQRNIAIMAYDTTSNPNVIQQLKEHIQRQGYKKQLVVIDQLPLSR